MGALDALRHEHELILDAVALMERTALLPETQDLDPAVCDKIVVFLREYADHRHHANEEVILFPVMRRNPMLARLADLLEAEHVEGRALLAAIEHAVDDPAHLGLRGAVLDYAAFIRTHIGKEEELVFEAVERELSAQEADELRAGLTSLEQVASF